MENILTYTALNFGDVKPTVKILQMALSNAKLYTGKFDGIYGKLTEVALMEFKKNNNLEINNTVDAITWKHLLKFIQIAYDIEFSYDVLIIYIAKLINTYSFLELNSIGNSVMGKSIPCIKMGKGARQMLYVASTHANEWITTPMLVRFIEEYCKAISTNQTIYGISARQLFYSSNLSIVPMLNPDGVNLVLGDISKQSDFYKTAYNIHKHYPKIAFPSGWKANIDGIDLNLQFPANWDKAGEIKAKQGYISPAPRDFVGNYPLEAPEAIAIYDYVIQNHFELLLTYHTQGNVIYWQYLDLATAKAKLIGEKFAKVSGYILENTPYASAFAGLKDWFISQYRLPAYTIEVGKGINPLPINQLEGIYIDNLGILVTGLNV